MCNSSHSSRNIIRPVRQHHIIGLYRTVSTKNPKKNLFECFYSSFVLGSDGLYQPSQSATVYQPPTASSGPQQVRMPSAPATPPQQQAPTSTRQYRAGATPTIGRRPQAPQQTPPLFGMYGQPFVNSLPQTFVLPQQMRPGAHAAVYNSFQPMQPQYFFYQPPQTMAPQPPRPNTQTATQQPTQPPNSSSSNSGQQANAAAIIQNAGKLN